jgi:methionyl-tRNA synthetase
MQLARLGNKYLAEAEPWKQIKIDPERVASIMYTALQIATGLAVLSEPFLPFTAKKLAHLLHLDNLQLKWEDVSEKKELIPTDHRIEKAQLLFQKIEDVQMEQQRAKLAASAEQNQTETQTIAPLKPQTSFEDFDSLKLQVAEILEAKKVPKTKKLMELKVQLGSEIRTVISGIAQDFDEAELIGKKVTLLSNLAPRTLKGIESKGMILLGENEQGQFVFVNPEDDTVQNGAEIL